MSEPLHLHPAVTLLSHAPLARYNEQDVAEVLRAWPRLPDLYLELLNKYGYMEFLFGPEDEDCVFRLRDTVEANEHYS